MIERLDGLNPISPQISNGGVFDSPAASSEQINLFPQGSDKDGQQVSDVFHSSLELEQAVQEQVTKEGGVDEKSGDLPLDRIIERLNHKMNLSNRSLRFKLDERIGRNYISIIDKETDEILKEYPPEEIRNFMAQVMKFEERMLANGDERQAMEKMGDLMVDVEV